MIDLIFLAGLIFFNSASAPATANLLDESFNTPAGGGPGGLGYDNTWTESGTGTIDENETAGCGSGAGWAGECFESTGATFDTGRTTNAFAAQSGDMWFSGVIKLAFATDDDEEYIDLWNLDTTVEAGGPRLLVRLTTPPSTYELQLASPAGVLDFVSFTSPTTMCVEVYMNQATDAWEWKIGGASQGSAGSGGAFSVSPTNLYLGMVTTLQGGMTYSSYWDTVKVGNTGWLGCP